MFGFLRCNIVVSYEQIHCKNHFLLVENKLNWEEKPRKNQFALLVVVLDKMVTENSIYNIMVLLYNISAILL